MNNLTDREKRAVQIDKLVNKKFDDHISPIDWYSRYDGLMGFIETINKNDIDVWITMDCFEVTVWCGGIHIHCELNENDSLIDALQKAILSYFRLRAK